MRTPLVAVACAIGLVLGAAPSQATFRGANGLLVYEAKVGPRHFQLFTVTPDGKSVHQLTHFADSDAVWGAWSPNGEQIAFERDFAGHAGVFTVRADGAGLRSLTPTGLNGRPSWSPNGKQLVFSRIQPGKGASIWIMAADGTRPRRLTSCSCQGLDSPSFSPNGQRIAFVWIRSERSAAVFTMNAAGGGLRRLTPWENGVADKIDWSPDGARVGFSSPEFGRPGTSSNVFTVLAHGRGLTRLTRNVGGQVNNGFDSWSPDGSKIAFVSTRDGSPQIYTMSRNGREVVQLTRRTEAHHASWGTHP
jgi:Tol biopolymer transport system component